MISFPDLLIGILLSSIVVSICSKDNQERIIGPTLIIIISSCEVLYFWRPWASVHYSLWSLLVAGNYSWLLPQFFFTYYVNIHLNETISHHWLWYGTESVTEYKRYPLIVLCTIHKKGKVNIHLKETASHHWLWHGRVLLNTRCMLWYSCLDYNFV